MTPPRVLPARPRHPAPRRGALLLTVVVAALGQAPGCGTSETLGPLDLAPPPDLAPAPAAVTAVDYHLKLDLATRAAESTVRLRVDQPGNCLAIGFKPPAASGVTLDGVALDEASATLDTEAARLTACRPGGAYWPAGAEVTLHAAFTEPKSTLGLSQIGFSVRKDAAGHPFTYLLSWMNGCDRHGLCDSQPGRFATYRFDVAHDQQTQVLCPGVISDALAELGPGWTTCRFTLAGGPTYSAYGLVAGQSWVSQPAGNWGGVEVTLHDYPQTQVAAHLDQAVHARHMTWLQALIGPYPYGNRLRLVVAPTYWLGFEHPGAIVLSENLGKAGSALGYSDALRHATMHEVTHQWAGDHKTPAGTYDFAWKESVAEYLTYVFEDEQIAPADGRATTTLWKEQAAASVHYPVPTDMPTLFAYYTDAYGEGPMIFFRQLEVMYSRKAVLAALAALLSGPPAAVSIDDLKLALEKATGARLDGYFAAWVRGSGAPAWPTALVKLDDAGGGDVRVTVSLATADGVARGCAFKVRLDEGAGHTLDVPVNFGPDGGPLAPVVVHPGFAVAETLVDPDDECLVWKAAGKLARPRRPGVARPALPARPAWIDPWYRP